jgi:hypothetical protein
MHLYTLETCKGSRLRCEPRTTPRMASGEGAKIALDHMP